MKTICLNGSIYQNTLAFMNEFEKDILNQVEQRLQSIDTNNERRGLSHLMHRYYHSYIFYRNINASEKQQIYFKILTDIILTLNWEDKQ